MPVYSNNEGAPGAPNIKLGADNMLTIEKGTLEAVQKEIDGTKSNYKKKLDGMKKEIEMAKVTLRNLKAHKVPKDDVVHQREYIQKLEANYSNAYHGAPKYRTPVVVKTTNGSILMDWDLLQSILRKLKNMIIDFRVNHSGHKNTLEIHYRSFNQRTRGKFELNPLEGFYEDLEHIPTATTY